MTFGEIIYLLRARLGEQLATQLSEQDDEKTFLELGVDSVIATELIEFIRLEVDPDLSVSVLFDFPNLRQLSRQLAAEDEVTLEARPNHGDGSGAIAQLERPVQPVRAVEAGDVGRRCAIVPSSGSYEPIAVIGLSGRFPGADNVEELWQNLAAAVCSTTEIPIERSRYWDLARLASRTGQSCLWGGFLTDVERFDPLFFGISPSEACVMDPQQRLFLEEAWKAVENAGYAGDALSESRCGVYVGLMNTDYEDLLTQAHALTPKAHELTGTAGSILASRIAYHLNLRGPAIAVDTACSSSAVAIHLACRALQLDEIDMALAGGVTLYLTQKRYNLMEQAGMLTFSGKCRPFDDAADGTVPGEGVGVVVLKRLKDAVRDGDFISGVILSTGINQAGKTNGITAPSMQSQLELITEVYRRGDIDPGTIQYIEAHGTGTKLGDPIELEALAMVYKNSSRQGQFCRLGSLKANLGHTTAAAGVAGLIKVLLSIERRAIPPQIHFEVPNRHIACLNEPFRVSTALESWETETGKPRRAALSAFGFSGTNSHLVVEEAPTPPERPVPSPARGFWVVLSAKTLRALEEKAAELFGWLESKAELVSLIDLSFTLSIGRSAFEERLAFVAHDLAEVRAGLGQFLGWSTAGIHLWRGKTTVDATKRAEFMEPGAAWVTGANVDWAILYHGLEPRRIPLPAYPFARERYWYDTPKPEPLSGAAATPKFSERAGAIVSPGNGEENRETLGRVRLKALSATPAPDLSREDSVRAASATGGDDFSRKIELSPQARQSQEAQTNERLRIELAGTPSSPGVRKGVVETEVAGRIRQLVARTFSVDQNRIPDAKKLVDLGLDSILAVELARGISAEFKINLPAARLYDHPSIQHLANYVGQVLKAGRVEPVDSPSTFFPTHLSIAKPSGSVAADFADRRTERSAEEHQRLDAVACNRRIRSLVALTLFLEEGKIDEGSKFADLGLDSILAVELVKRLNGEFGVNLSAATLYSHATTRQLAVHIAELLSGTDKGRDFDTDRLFAPVLARREPEGSSVAVGAPFTPAASRSRKDGAERAETPGKAKVHRVMITRSGSIADLRLCHEERTVLKADEVEISVRAASVMLADLLCARGLYPTMPPYPFTPGFEVAGTVMRAGGAVADFQPGDRVCGLTGAGLGGHADLVNVDSRLLVRIPEALTFSEACTLPVPFLTARYALSDVGRLAAEETLLIHSAASCTGLMAIQLARRAGVQVVATVGSQEKVTYLRRLGLEKVFNYHSRGVIAELVAALPGGRVNVILNLLTGPIRDQSLSLLAPEGRFLDLAVVGLKAVGPPDLSVLIDNQGYFGIDCRRLSLRKPSYVSRSLQELSDLVTSGAIQPLPVISQFALPDAKAAYELLESRTSVGRVVLLPMAGTSSVSAREIQTSEKVVVRETLPASAFEPIAVIGISGRFPGAPDLDSFWQNLTSAKSSIKEVPPGRWPLENFENGDPKSTRNGSNRWGGFLDDIEEFDAAFFNIARGEAEMMDPQHRLFLQEAWKALEDSGHSPRELAGKPCGVFVGIGPSDYYAQIDEPDAHSLTGNLGSGLAGRIAYVLDWTGPCLAVETACSSSFSALHLACASLGRRECELALAGGVHLATSPKVFLATTRMGLLSPTGRCRTFDAAADGWVVSEGVGAVILKRLDDAVRDTDHIYGIIRGCCLNHDGTKNGFTSPKAAAQAALQRRVYEQAGIHPETVDYVELHGTSSLLGDEIELLALKESFGYFTKRKGFCAIGSLKPNIGHSIAAAGITCLLKVLLALRQQQLPPLAGLEKVNEALGLDDSPFYLNTRLAAWERRGGRPRRAAINGLSASGTNCHLVIDEYIPESGPIGEGAPEGKRVGGSAMGRIGETSLVVLSARDSDRLRETVSNLLSFLDRSPGLRLIDVAFTLQTGRQEMEERLAFAACSLGEVKYQLSAFLDGGQKQEYRSSGVQELENGSIGELHKGRCTGSPPELLNEFLAAPIRNRSLDQLARLWTAGFAMDWSLLGQDGQPRRIPLPTYPFARNRYWFRSVDRRSREAKEPGARRFPDWGTDSDSATGLLRNIIAEVLRCAPAEIDPDRDLFRYGFGSLYILRVVDRFEAVTGFHLPARAFFECRTIGELVRTVIGQADFRTPVASQPGSAPGTKEDDSGRAKLRLSRGFPADHKAPEVRRPLKSFSLSEGQKALWSIQQSNPATTAYHVPVATYWDEPLDLKALKQAWQQLVQEQPALRTTFRFDVTEPIQMIQEAKPVVIRPENFLGLADAEIIRRIREVSQQPFDLERDPPWRVDAFSISSSRSILLFSLHHLVFDGHSLGLLLSKLERCYEGIRSGNPVVQRTITKSVADYVQIERCYLSSAAFQEDRAYWVGQFPNGFAPLGLGEAKAKESQGAGDVFQSAIPEPVVHALEDLATTEGVTLQAVFLAAFAGLLAVAGGKSEVVAGVAVDLRPSSDFEEIIGFFVNVLPIPAAVPGSASFRDLLRQVFGQLLDSLEHRRLPFRRLVQALAEERGDPGELQAAFYFQTWNSPEERRLADCLVPGIHQAGEFDLVFEVVEAPKDWWLNVKYRTALFAPGTIGRLAKQFQELLAAVARNPDQVLAEWQPEENRTPAGWATNGFHFPRDRCVNQLIEDQAVRTPDATAVLFRDQQITYQELDARANQLAHHLIHSGAGPGSLVGVMLERSLELPACLLAVWKIGAAYIPLDPSHPAERIEYILGDACAQILLTQSGCRLRPRAIRSVEIDLEEATIQQRPIVKPLLRPSPEDLAYVIYTSGSTGKPKGVQIAHRSLTHFLWSMAERPGCSSDDYFLAATTICFDIAALELFLPLITGARVEILPEEIVRNGLRFKEKIENSPTTLVQGTPATWKMLLAAELGPIPRVKALCGGEAWDSGLAEQLLVRTREVWNMYGPTETTVWSSIQKVKLGQPVCLGDPIGNTQFYVFDELMRPVQPGEIGELFIGGDGLAKGYLNRPELTRERFVPNPLRPEEVIYRTGDLVRYV
jgi:amino acid adenylation domain-containing protein